MMSRNFNELPQEVQNEIKSWLHVYDKTFVVYENGKYNVSSAVCLKAHYAPDHEVIGEYHAEDIFTEEERIENYINTFYSYPIEYKGKRDYQMLKKMQEREWVDEEKTAYRYWTGKLIDGNFELTEQKTRTF